MVIGGHPPGALPLVHGSRSDATAHASWIGIADRGVVGESTCNSGPGQLSLPRAGSPNTSPRLLQLAGAGPHQPPNGPFTVRSVGRQAGINLLDPRQNTATDVNGVGETGLVQHGERLSGPRT